VALRMASSRRSSVLGIVSLIAAVVNAAVAFWRDLLSLGCPKSVGNSFGGHRVVARVG